MIAEETQPQDPPQSEALAQERVEEHEPPSPPGPPRGDGQASGIGETEFAATPVARNLAAEYSVPLKSVHGTGPGGKITKDDVSAYVESQQTSSRQEAPQQAHEEPAVRQEESQEDKSAVFAEPIGPPPHEEYEERVRLSRRRLTIARRLAESQRETAPATTFNELDKSAVIELRHRRR
ncbi:MAG: E3 binding domain-containing protein, partial [Dehalococcoidia bacterium]